MPSFASHRTCRVAAVPTMSDETMGFRDNDLRLDFLIFSSVLLRGAMWRSVALKYHRGRMGEALREEIETLVEGELADPRIGLVSVTSVDTGGRWAVGAGVGGCGWR